MKPVSLERYSISVMIFHSIRCKYGCNYKKLFTNSNN